MAQRPKPVEVGPVRASTMKRQQGELWYWRARRTDTRETVWTGWATRETASQVLAALVARGLQPSNRAVRGGDIRTVGDLLGHWTAAQERRQEAGEIAPVTLRNYRQGAGYWLSAIADVLVVRLTRELVEDTCTTWQAVDGVAPRTCRMAVEVLDSACRWGAARGLVQTVDLKRVVRVRDDEHVNCSHTPSRHDVHLVLAMVGDDAVGDAVRMLAWTGARVGEVVALRVGDIDIHGGVLHLSGRDDARARRGKTPRRAFPLLGGLDELCGRRARGREPSAPLLELAPARAVNDVAARLRKVCEEAKVERFTPHGLRRFAALQLLEGADPKTVSKLLGHSVLTLLRTYIRPTDESLRRAVARAALASPGGAVLDLVRGRRS